MISQDLVLTLLFFCLGIGLFVYNIVAIFLGYHFTFLFKEKPSKTIEIDKKTNPKKFWFNTAFIFFISIVLLIFGIHSYVGSTDPFEFYIFPILISFVIISVIAVFVWKKL